MNRSSVIAATSLAAATLFWAGNYVLGAATVASIDPLSLLLLRWLIAAVPLFALAHLLERPHWSRILRTWPWLLALSLSGVLGYNFFLYAALQFTDAFSASVINSFNPALISLAAVLFLGARLNAATVLGTGLALVGVLTVLSDGDFSALAGTGFGTGEVLMCGAIISWTAYTIIGRRAPALPPITSTACQAAITLAALTPISAATGGISMPDTPQAGWALLFIGVFPTVLSYLLWNHALMSIPPAQAGVFINLITVFTAVFTVISGHPITIAQALGGGLVLAGIAFANLQAFRRKGNPPPEAPPQKAAGRWFCPEVRLQHRKPSPDPGDQRTALHR